MPQAHDFSKSLVPFENDTTLVAVIELRQSSWLIAGSVPGLYRKPVEVEVEFFYISIKNNGGS